METERWKKEKEETEVDNNMTEEAKEQKRQTD